MAHELVAADGHYAEAADVADGDPDAHRLFFLAAGDGREPAAEGALIEIDGEEADGERCFEQHEMVEIEERHYEGKRSDDCEGNRIPTAAEADVEDGAEEERPESGGKGDGGLPRY